MREQFDAMDRQRKKTRERELHRREGKRRDDPRLRKMNDESNSKLDRSTKDPKKDRAAGVAMVRTIVKQSRANHAVQVEQWNGSQVPDPAIASKSIGDETKELDDDEEHWQRIAQDKMEESAFRYGHRLALVRLGNEALERAREGVSDTTISASLVDTESCKEWLDESPIDLASILQQLSVNGEGNRGLADEGDDSHHRYHQLALRLYEEAGKRGSAEGWYNLGHLLSDTPSIQLLHSREKAMDAFHKAIELGDADAMYFVAVQYLSCEENEGGDNEALLSKIYEQYGQTLMASLQPKISGPSQTGERRIMSSLTHNLHRYGYVLLLHAANQHGHGPALHHLALLHNEHDHAEGFRQLLSKAADAGNPDSLFLRGHCHYSGSDGYDRNPASALENFLTAAESGHVDAMISAGAMLHQGVNSDNDDDGGRVVVERDQQRAFELYQQAGELGSVEGWRNVVSCYATGQGVPKCLDTAKYIANTMLKEEKN